MIQSVSFTSPAFEAFSETCFLVSVLVKNAEVIRFLAVFKKYVWE